MATKINPDFYGAENTFVNNTVSTKRSNYSIGDLLNLGIYTGGSLDFTASPWGIGKSSISSDFIFALGKSDVWTFHTHENAKNNTPIWFYTHGVSIGGDIANDILGSDATKATFAKALYKNRISPAVELASNLQDIKSTLAIDNGSIISLPSTQRQFAVTYADYQNLRAVIYDVWYKPEGSNTISRCELKDIISGTVTDIDNIIAIYIDIRERSSGTSSGITPSIGGSELDIPDFYKSCYYDSGDNDKWVRPWHIIHTIGAPFWSTNDLSMSFAQFGSNDAVLYNSDFETVTSNDIANNRNNSNIYGHISTKRQEFYDVAYHWEVGIMPYGSDPWTGTIIDDGSAYESGTYITYVYMALDGEYEDRTEAYLKAILHEVAFLGMPFTDRNHVTETIGGSNTYLPVFDDHLITTGNYVGGSASLDLPNANWGDIFGTDMPDYDPTYEPEPEPEPEGDSGDLSNITVNRYANTGGLSQYVLTLQKCVELIAFLNGRYLPTAADLDADFKGTNPQDYIVSVQKYPFELPYELGDPNIYIGKNNTGITAKWFSAAYAGLQPLPINNKCTYDFGEITISSDNRDYCYGDFRDYQNKILLFMPFVGTAELDPRLFINHTVGLIYTIDYNTGSCVAEIKRDGLTFETHISTISITVPFLAANMGQYQNQLAQLDYAKQLTKIKGVSTALSTAFSLGSAAQTTLAGGAPGMGQLSAITQGALQLATNATQLSQLDYQIEHTAPSVGTLSTASAANAWFMDPRARLVVVRPKMLAGYNAAQYSHVVGNACCKTGNITDFTGYTVAAAVKFGNVTTKGAHPRAATEQELQQLRRALINGAYL